MDWPEIPTSVQRYCRAYARRSPAWDREDIAAEGIRGAIEGGGPLSHAILDARRAMARRVLSGARDRARQIRWAAERPGHVEASDPCLLDVAQVLAQLDERQRSCVWLGIGLGWTWSSVGLAWGCSPAAAKMTAYRALDRLRSLYGG